MNLTVNVASRLAHFAAIDPDRAAVIVARTGKQFTFRELHANSDALAHGLVAAGITRGTRVAVMVPPSLEFFSLVFALFKVAAVPVMIDPGMGVRNLGRCLEEAEPKAFIGINKAHYVRRLFSWGKLRLTEKVESFWQRLLKWPESSPYITVNVGPTRQFCNFSSHELRHWQRGLFESPDVKPEEMAAILYTSGSTGPAKGAVYTHGIFNAQVDMLKQIYGIEPGEIDFCTFPLFALFGPALGMTCIVPPLNAFSPQKNSPENMILATKAMKEYGITNMFASPVLLWGLSFHGFLSQPEIIPTLRRVISAGAPASFVAIEQATQILPPGVEVNMPYGATEALPVTNIGSNEFLSTRELSETGHGICIGRPVPGVNVYIIPITDDSISEYCDSGCLQTGQIGEFVVRGLIVTKSYYRRNEATQLAKMFDPGTGETLHRMGDVGYMDDQGRLWFCGRKNQRVNTHHGTLFPNQVEAIFKPVLGPFMDAALVGVRKDQHIMPVICFTLMSKPEYHRGLADELRARAQEFEMTRPITVFLPHPKRFPVDPRHNAKINREKLAVWAAEQLRKTKA